MTAQFDKSAILSEIRRTAEANGGTALGWRRFEQETGIRYYDWYGQYWSRWGDAVREAGVSPNRLSERFDDTVLLDCLVQLTRELGRVPTSGDIMLAAKDNPAFPSEKVFRRLGAKPERAARVVAHCDAIGEHDDVAALWKVAGLSKPRRPADSPILPHARSGFVYMIKHGSRAEYKIGRTNNPLRREGEIGVQLPERLAPLHYIETDDPSGVERYWHTRFADKRKEGEWFALDRGDVAAFKRWKRIF